MTTKTTKTTTREYDGDGKLVKETITEVTESENVSPCNPLTYPNPNIVYTGDGTATPMYKTEVTCICCGEPIPEGLQVCPNCERKAHE